MDKDHDFLASFNAHLGTASRPLHAPLTALAPGVVAHDGASEPTQGARGHVGGSVLRYLRLGGRLVFLGFFAIDGQAERLTGKGYPAFVVNPSGSSPAAIYRVHVGRYNDRREAEQVARRLEKEEQFKPWISH